MAERKKVKTDAEVIQAFLAFKGALKGIGHPDAETVGMVKPLEGGYRIDGTEDIEILYTFPTKESACSTLNLWATIASMVTARLKSDDQPTPEGSAPLQPRKRVTGGKP